MSAITTATIIGISAAAASTGATVYAAKKGANAAKDAARQQTDAAEKALETQRESYATQRQDFSPYQRAGNEALQRLQDMGRGPRNTFDPGAPMRTLGNPTGPGSGNTSIANARPGSGGMGQMGMNSSQAPPGGPIAAQGMAQGGPPSSPLQGQQMVLMQGPDGAKRPVPANVAEQLKQRGFTVVSGA